MADNTGMKFCQDIYNHWVEAGHEVKFERGTSEYLAQWADIYYIDWWDGNLNYLWKLYNGVEGVSRTPDWNNDKKPKVIVRAIDWDVWCSYVPQSKEYTDFVDKAICIAPHMEKRLRENGDFGSPGEAGDKLKLIIPGVNLDKFPLKTTKTDGFQVGMVLGDMWWYKNHMGGLDIFRILAKSDPRWHLHIRGQHEPGQYNPVMYEHYIESRQLKDRVTLWGSFGEMNEFYEKLDYLLHPGMKESFCYAVAEAMCKGIKPVVNHFYGACADIPDQENIWGHWMLYDDHSEAVKMFDGDIEPEKYRNIIKEHYPLDRMLKEIDEWIGIA